MVPELTPKTFLLFAARHYRNSRCLSISEFKSDLSNIKQIRRLLRKYVEQGILDERKILNHIIALYNVFTVEGATELLLFRLDDHILSAAKSFLLYLNYLPESVLTEVEPDILVAATLAKM